MKRPLVIAGAIVLLAGTFAVGFRAGAQTAVPSQQQARDAASVISAFIEAHPDTTTTTARTTTTAATTTTTTVKPTTTTAATTTTTALPQALAALHPDTSWDWQIGGSPNPSVLDAASGRQKMLDVDMEGISAAQIAAIRAKGIVAVCYIETGSWEDYRSDAGQFPQSALGNPLDAPYTNERYLDITNSAVESLIKARIDRAAAKGCQGIEPDLDDTWQGNGYNTGFDLSYAAVLAYNHRLADHAHAKGLTFGLKNAAGTKQVADSVPFTDWALNEQCNQYGECNYGPYVAAGKAVFQVEYGTSTGFCAADNAANYDGLAKRTSLTASFRIACRNG